MSKRLLVLLLTCAVPGCAHYGWAATDTPRVGVATVQAAPDAGFDNAALTRHLVRALERRGLRASWGSGEVALTCSAVGDDRLTGTTADAATIDSTLSLRCLLSSHPDVRLSRTLGTQGTLSGDLSASQRQVRLDTAFRAANLIAHDVEKLLLSDE